MKRIFAAILTILLLLGLFAGCQAPANAKNVLEHRTMTSDEKEAYTRLLYENKHRLEPFYEDGFGYGVFYLGTINGWDIIYWNCQHVFTGVPEMDPPHPDLKLGDVQFEGSCNESFLACKPKELKYLYEVYNAGQIGDEPLPELLTAYQDAYKKMQTITVMDAEKGYGAFSWLHWDLVGKGEKFPWSAYAGDLLPLGLLPDEVIEGRLQPDEWTEEKPQS